MTEVIENVLAQRYASEAMKAIWSARGKIIAERRLWLAVLKAQRAAGRDISDDDIIAYEKNVEVVDLASIAAREAILRHDVKARIEEYNALAGCQHIHEAMTSRDLTDNVEQVQIHRSLELVRNRAVAILRRLRDRTNEYEAMVICGRTHNVPAQATTLGKRFAMWMEEFLCAFEHLESIIATYPLRGMKGPVGTQQDMQTLLGTDNALQLEVVVREHLGFGRTLVAVGQVYPRSLDFMVVAALAQLASAPANFASTMRLMAGQSQVTEGFKEGQTGSSAMPHKMNMRTCERIGGFLNILSGYVTMASGLMGHQWYEGDVSCSVPRRILLSDAFFALDGLFEATMTVLDEMAVFPAIIERELATELPFLSTTAILMAAIDKGMGREDAHALIKRYSTAALTRIRQGEDASVFSRLLGMDSSFPLSAEEIDALIVPNTGLAEDQADTVMHFADLVISRHGAAAGYNPAPIL
ncbi:MAG: adenylosuccinate lyase [Patescibacteria group bacterium]